MIRLSSFTVLAVTFDLDDTIVEKKPSGPVAFVKICQRLGLAVSDDRFRVIERLHHQYFGNKDRLRRRVLQLGVEGFWQSYNRLVLRVLLGGRANPSDIRFITEEFATRYSPEVFVDRDTLCTLNALKNLGIPIGMITDRNVVFRGAADPGDDLVALGLASYFRFIIGGTPNTLTKPDPEAFMLAAEKFGIGTHDLLHVGNDFYSDYQAAVNAGAKALLLDKHNIYPEVTEKISRLSEIIYLFLGANP